jgi:hypothetical protein
LFAYLAKYGLPRFLFAFGANKYRFLLAFIFSACENAFIRSILSAQNSATTGFKVNTFTQQHMTTGRNAFGLPLLAGNVLASLPASLQAQRPSARTQQAAGKPAAELSYASDADQPRADFVQEKCFKQDGERCHRQEPIPHIRGENP